MKESVSQLLGAYHALGKEIPWLIQGAGGNLSVKNADYLWIKGTGLRFDEIHSENQLSQIRRNLSNDLEKAYRLSESEGENQYDLLIRNEKTKLRPSMETGFHLGLSKKWVFHYHSLVGVLFYDWAKKNLSLTQNFLSQQDLSVDFIEYTTPGFMLSQRLNSLGSDIFILQNHGVVFQSDEDNLLDKCLHFEKNLQTLMKINKEKVVSNLQNQKEVSYFNNFPDAVIVEKNLTPLKTQKNINNPFSKISNLTKTELNTLEVWQASSILHYLEPQTMILSDLEKSKLLNLPTEKARMSS